MMLRIALWTPGMLHIVSNMQQEVLKSMPAFDQWLEDAKKVSEFFGHQWTRKRFVGVCMRNATSVEEALVGEISAKMLQHRWGSVVAFLGQFIPCHGIIDQYWDLALLKGNAHLDMQGCEVGDEVSRRRKTLVDKVDKIIRSLSWWAYARMVLFLAAAHERFANWCEGCACHPRRLLGTGSNKPTHAEAASLLHKNFGIHACGMAGKRAPELAGGKAEEVLVEATRRYNGEVHAFCLGLSREDREVIIQDWYAGTARTVHVLASKLGFWTRLPYLLCGLCHHKEHVVQRTAQQAIALFDQAPDTHALSLLVCSHYSIFRGQLELVAAEGGAVLMSDPRCRPLFHFVCRLRFVPIVERTIEGRHRTVHQEILRAPNAGPALISLASRRLEMQHLMDRDILDLRTLAGICSGLRSPQCIADSLRLALHPQLACRKIEWHDHGRVAAVVYRCDIRTQQEKRILGDDGDGATGKKQKQKKARRPEPKDAICMEVVGRTLCAYAFKRFQDVAEEATTFFSMKNTAARGSSVVVSLRGPHTLDDPFFDELDYHIGRGDSTVFFKVVKLNLRNEKPCSESGMIMGIACPSAAMKSLVPRLKENASASSSPWIANHSSAMAQVTCCHLPHSWSWVAKRCARACGSGQSRRRPALFHHLPVWMCFRWPAQWVCCAMQTHFLVLRGRLPK